jgi:DNA polymerase
MTNIVEKIESYLRQQRELTGDVLTIEPKRTVSREQQPLSETASKAVQLQQEITPENTSEILQTNIQSHKLHKQFIMPQRTADLLFGETPEWMSATDLPILYNQIHTCQNCALGATRTTFVFGTGNPNADIMVIGEAPGADEDAQGEPFVGAAGQLLTKILAAIGIQREEVYIANIIKCRPPNNRRPEKNETEQCEPYLMKQIELIQPKFILAVGLTAANTLLKSENKMGDIRGRVIDYHGITMIVTYHPAALLRNPNWKQATWDDVKLLRKLYDDQQIAHS